MFDIVIVSRLGGMRSTRTEQARCNRGIIGRVLTYVIMDNWELSIDVKPLRIRGRTIQEIAFGVHRWRKFVRLIRLGERCELYSEIVSLPRSKSTTEIAGFPQLLARRSIVKRHLPENLLDLLLHLDLKRWKQN